MPLDGIRTCVRAYRRMMWVAILQSCLFECGTPSRSSLEPKSAPTPRRMATRRPRHAPLLSRPKLIRRLANPGKRRPGNPHKPRPDRSDDPQHFSARLRLSASRPAASLRRVMAQDMVHRDESHAGARVEVPRWRPDARAVFPVPRRRRPPTPDAARAGDSETPDKKSDL